MYKPIRLASDFTLDEAQARLYVGRSTLCKYESGEWRPPPEVILGMAELYSRPDLPAIYCKKECAIGQKYSHDLTRRSIVSAVIQVVNGIKLTQRVVDPLLRIIEDEQITDDEIEKVVEITLDLLGLEHRIGEYKISLTNHIPWEVIMQTKNRPTACKQVKSVNERGKKPLVTIITR